MGGGGVHVASASVENPSRTGPQLPNVKVSIKCAAKARRHGAVRRPGGA